MSGLFDLGLGGDQGNIAQQIEIVDEQIEEMRSNPELSDTHKEREIKKLELVKAQIIEGAERAGLQAERFEREGGLFDD